MIDKFREDAEQCIDALDKLLQSRYICMSDKHLMRVNRFKRWVIDLIAEEQPTSNNNN